MAVSSFLRVFPLCALLLTAACGSDVEPAKPTGPTDKDTDESTADDEDEDAPAEPLDAGKGKLDAGLKPAPTPDTGVAGDAKVPVANKSDASVVSPDGGPDVKPDAGPVVSAVKPKCMKKDSQLIVIGDSYINWISHTFPDDIVKESGQKWRMKAIGGTSMGSGGIGPIPDQYYNAIKEDPDAHSILMDGGGNDILVADPTIDLFHECQDTGSSKKANCQKIVQLALDAADKLTLKAAEDGIRDVVYFFYPHVPANTILSGPNPDEILDYALPKVRAFCEEREAKTGGKLRCHFVDLVPVFEGHKDWFNEDIHPNSKGSAAMAAHIWKFMQDKCIGQKSGAGCCEE